MRVELDGRAIRTARDFHNALAQELDLEPYYGKNLDALWDVLSASVERPLALVWLDAQSSRAAMGEGFDAIVEVLRRVEEQDRRLGWTERFELILS